MDADLPPDLAHCPRADLRQSERGDDGRRQRHQQHPVVVPRGRPRIARGTVDGAQNPAGVFKNVLDLSFHD